MLDVKDKACAGECPLGSPAGASMTGPLPCDTGYAANCVASGSGTVPGPGYSDGSATPARQPAE
jgi:hypothetical protein